MRRRSAIAQGLQECALLRSFKTPAYDGEQCRSEIDTLSMTAFLDVPEPQVQRPGIWQFVP